MILISAEPGLGKTRLVQECRKLFMAWVGAASGRLPLWLEGRAASYAASRPYGLYQQLLSAWVGVAPEDGQDKMRGAIKKALGAVFGEKACDERAKLFDVVMGVASETTKTALARLGPEQLQRATFDAVRSVVSRLAAYGPAVLVLEDLHWADATSLRLTEELSHVTKEAPLLLVLTRRPEPDPGVSALEAALGANSGLRVRHLELAPLPVDAERDLVNALVGAETADEVVDAVREGTDGNPFFVEERFCSLLETGALARDEDGWHIDRGLSPHVPEAIERLFRSRVDRLPAHPRQAIVAASVLGPEFGAGALRSVTDLGDNLESAVSELCSGGLLMEVSKQTEPYFRFRHSLIQETTYKGMLQSERTRLHTRAAWGLEASSAGRIEEVAGVLGHHFAMAGETGRAVHYLEMAGDSATWVFANDEAIVSFRYCLDLLGHEGTDAWGYDAAVKAETDIRLKFSHVLSLMGRASDARETVKQGLAAAAAGHDLEAARLHNNLGWLALRWDDYAAAATEFEAALTRLGNLSEGAGTEVFDIWLESQIGLVELHYCWDEPGKIAAIFSVIDPAFKARGMPRERQPDYFGALLLWQLSERRHRVDEELLDTARKGLAATKAFSQPTGLGGNLMHEDIGWKVFNIGICLLFYGDFDGAEQNLRATVRIADRVGGVAMRAESMTYLNLLALRRHDPVEVTSLAAQAIEAMNAAGKPQYAAAVKASLAWVAWKTGRLDEVEGLAREALACWPAGSRYPFRWVCLWPLIAVRLGAGQLAKAVEAARQLLPAPQQRLPDELEDEVKAAIGAWETGDPVRAAETLAAALKLAEELRFA